MPAKSLAQKHLMDAAAHNPAFAKKVGIPTKVAKEYSQASKGQTFKRGGEMKKVKKMMDGGMSNAGGAMRGLDRAASMSGRDFSGVGQRPAAPTLPAAAAGRPVGMKKGGATKKMASGGYTRAADGVAQKGKTKGKIVTMKKGGKC